MKYNPLKTWRETFTFAAVLIDKNFIWNMHQVRVRSIPLNTEKYRADGLKRSRCFAETDFTNSRPFFKPSATSTVVPAMT